jgi:hypothetical protein
MNITLKAFALKHGIKVFKLQNKIRTKVGQLISVQDFKRTRFGNVPLYDEDDLMPLVELLKKSDALFEKRKRAIDIPTDCTDYKQDFYAHQIQKQHTAVIKSLAAYGEKT